MKKTLRAEDRRRASQELVPRIVGRALRLAEDHCREANPLGSVLLIDGPRGMAVLRLDFESPDERTRLLTKARLMATALSAEACACMFQSRLQLPRVGRIPVVVVIAETRFGGGAVRLFARGRAGNRPALHPLEGGLVGPRLAGTLADIIDGLLPLAPSEQDSARAWRQLEEMGVNIGGGGRALH